MLLTHELVLLSRQPDGGPLIHDLVLDRVLAGSLLADLRLAHKITIDGDGSGTTVTVTDPSPTGGAVLDAALADIATIAPTDLKTAVKHLDHDLSAKFRADLTADGHLHEQTHRVLGSINNTHWTAADAAQHEDLIAHVRAWSTTATVTPSTTAHSSPCSPPPEHSTPSSENTAARTSTTPPSPTPTPSPSSSDAWSATADSPPPPVRPQEAPPVASAADPGAEPHRVCWRL